MVLHETRGGEFLAEASPNTARYHCDAVAIEPSELLRVPAEAIRKFLDTDREWIALLAGRLRAKPELILQGTLKNLACALGLTHEALYRTLAAMRHEGVIERRDRLLLLMR